MIDLHPDAFAQLLPLLEGIAANHLFVRSVLERQVDGRVLVDRPERPWLAYVIHPYGMTFLLAGEAQVDSALLKASLPECRGAQDQWMQVSPQIPASLLDEFLDASNVPDQPPGGARVQRYTRANFRFNPSRYAAWRTSLPPLAGCTPRPMRAEDFALPDIGVSPHCFWRDAGQFLAHGGGWCIERSGEVLSMAFTSFRFDAQLEIGIETRAAHRRQGYALHAARAFLDQCVAQALEPVWACRKENTGSYELAKTLGFDPTLELPYYRLPAV